MPESGLQILVQNLERTLCPLLLKEPAVGIQWLWPTLLITDPTAILPV